ncbi:MAG: glutamyl-tRNA reductase, partial [Actinomycetota bacterium]|nr:glutamyl-tRNA reductase [Actinomycetota bacterium]
RVGKRVHSETAIDRHGASVVSLALDHAAGLLGGLAGRTATLVGAGAMAGLAVAHLHAAGIAELIVVNRTRANAERFLSDPTAPEGVPEVRIAGLAELPTAIAASDLVVACTGATGTVIGLTELTGPRGDRSAKVIVDLALPHDVDPAVGSLPNVTLLNLAALGRLPGHHSQAENDAAVMVDAETSAFLAMQAALSVEPIVVSLRARADGILEEQVRRLRLKLPQLDDAAAAEVEKAMRRAMSALLHTPTVRMKQFAADPGGEQFAAAVQALFDLDPAAVQALSTPPEGTDD